MQCGKVQDCSFKQLYIQTNITSEEKFMMTVGDRTHHAVCFVSWRKWAEMHVPCATTYWLWWSDGDWKLIYSENDSWYSRWWLIPPHSLTLAQYCSGESPCFFWGVCVCVCVCMCVWLGVFTSLLLCKQTTFKWTPRGETHTQTHTCVWTLCFNWHRHRRCPRDFIFWCLPPLVLLALYLCSSQHGAVCVCVCVCVCSVVQ